MTWNPFTAAGRTLGRAAQRGARLLGLMAALAPLMLVQPPAAHALVEIDLSKAITEPMPIAITDFAGGDLAMQIARVVEADLASSGLFAPLDRAAFIDKVSGTAGMPRFEDWRVVNAQALVTGQAQQAGGQVTAEFRLWDVFAGEQMTGQRFTTSADSWRRAAHKIADAIYESLTGEKGYFDTRVAYVAESGPKQKRVKQLAIMDQDGANKRVLTSGKDLVLTPRFSPDHNRLAYMSFDGGDPRVYLLDIGSGRRQLVGNLPTMSFSPRFSPDGSRLVMSLQEGGNSNIYAMSLGSGQMQKLTDTAAIDTAPSFSPDGSKIAFESDRGGRQQIYVMGADGSGATRISFGQGSYATPVWSPKGDYIAFTKQVGGKFAIGVMKPDGSGERILTEGFHNEGPTWAPNGRVLMFFRDAGGGPQLHSIDITGYNERKVPTEGFASDPTWSPLLN